MASNKSFLLIFSLLFLSLATAYASSYGTSSTPASSTPVPKPAQSSHKVPKLDYEKILDTIGIQGVVYCKSANKLTPLEGAVVRVTCFTVEENGYESAPFSILSESTDEKGYFFMVHKISELESAGKIKECKAFLNYSPLEACEVPTDSNNGISGALLSSHRNLLNKKMKLYSLRPFVYASQPEHVNNGY